MKQLGILCTLALLLFVIAPARGFAQGDDNKPKAQDEAKPQQDRAKDNDKAKQDEKAQQGQKAQQDQKAQQEERARQNDRAKQDEKAQQEQQKNQAKENQKAQQQQERNQRNAQQEQERNAKNAQQEQERNAREQDRNQRPVDNRPAENRSQEMGRNYNHPAADRGRRIPDNDFRAHFGREHRFHVQRNEIVNVQQPVVVYGGYSWELAQPWPSDWSYDDDCYIDEVNGEYFLFDVLHPGVQIAVFIAG